MANYIKEGIDSLHKGIEVGVFSIDDINQEFLRESKSVIFGTPTYYASTTWQIKKWFDESNKINLHGKIGAVYATADYQQGGADIALLTIINHLMVKGMLVYSGGSALGQPYIHLGPVVLKNRENESFDLLKCFGKRIADKCLEVFA